MAAVEFWNRVFQVFGVENKVGKSFCCSLFKMYMWFLCALITSFQKIFSHTWTSSWDEPVLSNDQVSC